MTQISGLDKPCSVCGRTGGDHTLREWAECLGTTTLDLPFERNPQEAVRNQLGLDDDVIMADHVVVKAVVLGGYSGIVRVKVPALIHEFAIGVGGQPPRTAVKVAFAGTRESLEKYATLIAQSAKGSIDASEGR